MNLICRFIILFSLFFLLGCSSTSSPFGVRKPSRNLRTQLRNPQALAKLKKIVILPPLVRHGIEACTDQIDSYREIRSNLQSEMAVEIVSGGEIAKELQSVAHIAAPKKGAELAREYKADSFLLAQIHDCKSRTGSRIGSEGAAAIAFSLILFEQSGPSETWRADFGLHQKAVLTNLLDAGSHLDSKPGWSDTQTLFQKGLRLALRDLAERRDEQFLAR